MAIPPLQLCVDLRILCWKNKTATKSILLYDPAGTLTYLH